MARLTLNVNESVVARAKHQTARRGISVSRLVEELLMLVVGGAREDGEILPPILAQLHAETKGASVKAAAYRRYLERKCR